MTRSLPVINPESIESTSTGTTEADARIAGFVLAAGTSSRFGESNKLLANIDGDPVVSHTTRTLLDAGLDPVIVVTGHESGRVSSALSDLPVRTVENPAFESGHGSSIATGIESLPSDVRGLVIALGDMPFVDAETVRTLVAAYNAGAGTALAAGHDGKRGNPVLFGQTHFDELRELSGDAAGRSVLLDAPDAVIVETGDPGVRRDIDTPGDIPDDDLE